MTPLEGSTYWYRYVDDIEHERGFCVHNILLHCFQVISETPCTVLLDIGYGKTRRCYKTARKSFAYPSKSTALNSYRIRKNWQVARLAQQYDDARIMEAAAALVTGLLAR